MQLFLACKNCCCNCFCFCRLTYEYSLTNFQKYESETITDKITTRHRIASKRIKEYQILNPSILSSVESFCGISLKWTILEMFFHQLNQQSLYEYNSQVGERKPENCDSNFSIFALLYFIEFFRKVEDFICERLGTT